MPILQPLNSRFSAHTTVETAISAEMFFDECRQITKFSIIGNGLKDMKGMQHLEMDFMFCSQLTDISAIGDGLPT